MVDTPLEERVVTAPTQPDIIKVLPLDEYEQRFAARYHKEKPFRDIVHSYLKLGRKKRVVLRLSKTFMPWKYRRDTAEMIKVYAAQIHESVAKAAAAQVELLEYKRRQKEVDERAHRMSGMVEAYDLAEEEKKEAYDEHARELEYLEEEQRRKAEAAREQAATQVAAITEATDAVAVIRKHLTRHVGTSPLVRMGPGGSLTFVEEKIVGKLEDMFLADVVADLEREGTPAFMSKVRQEFDAAISHYDELEDLDELADVDWVESIIYARTKGYRKPVFPYLIVGKREARAQLQAAVDSAIALDTSGSMQDDNKFQMAQKTTLAMHALMRKLSPNNRTYLCHYNGDYGLQEISTLDLMRRVHPEGGTPTHEALRWLQNKLSDQKRISVAYLITDGLPDNVNACVNVASQFRDNPYLLLRIFLIDSNASAIENIRAIGTAAGPATKVIPVTRYNLANGVIKDVADALGDAKNIADF